MKISRIFRSCLIIYIIGLIFVAGIITPIYVFPRLGAKAADLIRGLLGPQAVGNLEGTVLVIQDVFDQIEFKLGGEVPVAPWQITPVAKDNYSNGGTTKSTIFPTQQSNEPTIPTVPASSTWILPPVHPLGTLQGEGGWIPYIQDEAGDIVAYRTFLQPDPQRPYVVVVVVAFDLTKTQLHYVIGTKEPEVPIVPKPLGIIPTRDRVAGTLLAAFNGGYKTVNGHFGIMYDNSVLLKPIDKLGTVALYRDGSIRIGEWGTDIRYTKGMVSFRQNCPLMVHNGIVNPQVYDNSVNKWGGTISGFVVDYRSGLGISQDGKVLYYFAGEATSMPDLAIAMQDAGTYQAMQLDINSYYVLFTSIKFGNGQFHADPLLQKGMENNVNRYLGSYTGDFFYITATTSHP